MKLINSTTRHCNIFSHAMLILIIICRYEPIYIRHIAERARVAHQLFSPSSASPWGDALQYLIELKLIKKEGSRYVATNTEKVSQQLLFNQLLHEVKNILLK